MILNAVIEGRSYPIEVTEQLLQDAEDFFSRMDADMDQGWQMSRQWVDNPDREQRCQIAADKLAQAIVGEQQELVMMMAGYILSRLPGVGTVHIDTAGDMSETEFEQGQGA